MRHIGNIKLGPIHWLHRRADLSLFIGERKYWGQGYASEAIALVRDWAFRELDLQKLNAGIYSGNHGSRRAFEKCGFELEGTLRQRGGECRPAAGPLASGIRPAAIGAHPHKHPCYCLSTHLVLSFVGKGAYYNQYKNCTRIDLCYWLHQTIV